MAGKLSVFTGLEGVENVYTAENGNLRCMAIALRDGSVCIFSPVQGLNEAAVESLARIGAVRFLLAPNHYHNKALKEYADVFPKAQLCAPDGAIPRLQKITGQRLDNLDGVKALLEKHSDFIEPEGLKTGEVWLRIKAKSLTAWLVVDAFCGSKIEAGKTHADTPELLKTFPSFGVGQKDAFVSWVNDQIGRDQPGVVVPCHGSIIRAEDLAKKLKKLISDNF